MSMEKKKRVCVVGAGASGLPSIRHAFLYGFDVICYEGQNDIGGLWSYKPEETEDGSVMKSTVINTSKEITAYSDFPPEAEDGNYMHNVKMCGYLKSYAEHYDLIKYIKFNTKVVSIDRSTDYTKTGRWNVTIEDKNLGITTTEIFDGVLMCNGHHTTPYWPAKWPGQDKFKGQIIHSHSYKDHRGYEDKVVVIVGIGNSGGDAAVEMSRIAKQAYLVTRRGAWILNRVFNYGKPIDCVMNTRFFDMTKKCLIRRRLTNRFDHEEYGLKPKHGIFNAHPTVNDELPNRIACATLRIKPQIAEFTEHGIVFTDGTSVDHVDTVILCTGYSFEFPIIEHGNLIMVKDNEVNLYKHVFPLICQHDTLGFIGLIQPLGSIMPIAEMQARVVLDVLSGRTKLPSMAERIAHVDQTKKRMAERYVKSNRHTIQVDYIPYMDELSQLIGCEPPKWYAKMFTDPQLAMHILFAPHSSYFYRLRGPHTWNGAREAIFTIEDRIVKATNRSMSGSIYNMHNEGLVLVATIFCVEMIVLVLLIIYLLFRFL